MKSNSFFTSRLGGANPIPYHPWSCLRFRPLSAIVVAIVVVSHLSAGYARDTARNTSNDSSSKASAQPVLTSNEPSSKASAQPALTPNEPSSKASAQPALTSNEPSSKASAQPALTPNEPSSIAPAQPALTPNDPSSKTSAQPALITLSIQTSSPQPAAGTGLGISAEIKNISDSTVYIKSKELALVLPPEITPTRLSAAGGYAFLPTETDGRAEFNYANASIALSPGDTYKAFWKTTLSPTNQSRIPIPGPLLHLYTIIASEMKFIFFYPSDYKIAVVAKYNTSPDFSGEHYRTLVQDSTIPVGTPQFVILFGAAIGGLFAYFILPQARRRLIRTTEDGSRKWTQRLITEVSGVVGSILLSEMTTILLSRNSDPQFLFKVNINDFWSAIAVGFLANCVGAFILSKVLFQVEPAKSLQANLTPKPQFNPAPKPHAGLKPVASSVQKPEANAVPNFQANSGAKPEADPSVLNFLTNSGPKPEADPSVPNFQANSGPKPEASPVLNFQASSGPKPEADPSVPNFQTNSGPRPEANPAPTLHIDPEPKPEALPVHNFQASSGPKPKAKTLPKPRAAKPVKKPQSTSLAAAGGRDSHGRWMAAKRKNKTAPETMVIKTETQGKKSK